MAVSAALTSMRPWSRGPAGPAGTPASDRSQSPSNIFVVAAAAAAAGRWVAVFVVVVVVDETHGWQPTEASLRVLAIRQYGNTASLARLQRAE